MVQNCDNDILDGLAVANLLQTQNPLFLSWRDWRLSLLFPSKPIIEVKCSLIDEYVKKPSAHGTSTFNGSNVYCGCYLGRFSRSRYNIYQQHYYITFCVISQVSTLVR
jgi:hypothetical protein